MTSFSKTVNESVVVFWVFFVFCSLDRTLFPSVSHDVLKVMNVLNHASSIVHSLCRTFITDDIIFTLGYKLNNFNSTNTIFILSQFEHIIAIKY